MDKATMKVEYNITYYPYLNLKIPLLERIFDTKWKKKIRWDALKQFFDNGEKVTIQTNFNTNDFEERQN